MTSPRGTTNPIMLEVYATKALRQSHNFAYAHLTPNLHIGQVSPNFAEMMNMSLADVVGKPAVEVFEELIGAEEILTAVLTGKQPNLRAYYDRRAILGRDARGGAMALLVATERIAWEQEGKSP